MVALNAYESGGFERLTEKKWLWMPNREGGSERLIEKVALNTYEGKGDGNKKNR